MLFKRLPLLVVLALIAAGAIFLARSWVDNGAPQSSSAASRPAPTTPAASIPAPTTAPTVTPTPTQQPKPSATAAPTTRPTTSARPAARRSSTAYIERRVESSLNAKSPLRTRVVCPSTTPLAARVSLTCHVYDAADRHNRALARVTVRLVDASGRFVWQSVSLR